MAPINHLLLKLAIRARNLRQNVNGQDLIEYALMAGFVAVAAGALMPNIASSISTVFSKISSILGDAAAS
jgi:pilus assembly protein Flp/PilA